MWKEEFEDVEGSGDSPNPKTKEQKDNISMTSWQSYNV